MYLTLLISIILTSIVVGLIFTFGILPHLLDTMSSKIGVSIALFVSFVFSAALWPVVLIFILVMIAKLAIDSVKEHKEFEENFDSILEKYKDKIVADDCAMSDNTPTDLEPFNVDIASTSVDNKVMHITVDEPKQSEQINIPSLFDYEDYSNK